MKWKIKLKNLINSKKYDQDLYECLSAIYNNSAKDKKLSIQGLLIIKNLIKIVLNSYNKGNFKNFNKTGISTLISRLK